MSSTCHTIRVGPEHILARLKALRDPRMRVLALIEALCEDDPTAWVHAMAAIITRAHRSDDLDAAAALEAITHAAADPALAYGVRQQLYEAATAQRQPAIARLFLIASPTTMNAQQLARSLAPDGRSSPPAGRSPSASARPSRDP